ncbi:hypothetical protein DFH11DRAFT_1722490 [Phellopilus nigrolimitatus]|nr:hypothetical protein DFH11DRAFT_1722490 [Phellopilus nigrolimitatus]
MSSTAPRTVESSRVVDTTVDDVLGFAATNLKGTNLPAPAPVAPESVQHKTLLHALGRAATTATQALQSTGTGPDEKATRALLVDEYIWGLAFQISDAHLTQNRTIRVHFLQPRQATLTNSIAVALRVRQAVSASWLELDTAKEAFKTAGPATQERSRLEVENAEGDLLGSIVPEPLKNLNELVKAQLAYRVSAVETPSASPSPARRPARQDDRPRQNERGRGGLRTEQTAPTARAASGTNARALTGDEGGAALCATNDTS